MLSAYKLKKQGDNIQPWRTPFPVWNQSIIPCPVLTVASWAAYRFLRRQVKWSSIPIFLRIFHILLWSSCQRHSQWRRSRCFCELCGFPHDPMNVGNLLSGSSAFSNPASTSGSSPVLMYCWSLAWRISSITLLAYEMSTTVWTSFCIAPLWDWNENWPAAVLWPLLFSQRILGVCKSRKV